MFFLYACAFVLRFSLLAAVPCGVPQPLITLGIGRTSPENGSPEIDSLVTNSTLTSTRRALQRLPKSCLGWPLTRFGSPQLEKHIAATHEADARRCGEKLIEMKRPIPPSQWDQLERKLKRAKAETAMSVITKFRYPVYVAAGQ